MGGVWLSYLKNAVNNIRLLLILFHEEIIKTSSVKKRVGLNDGHQLGGFVDDPEDPEDDNDIEENVDAEDDVDPEDDADIEEDDVDVEDDIDERAARFIADFYKHLQLERQLDLERQRLDESWKAV